MKKFALTILQILGYIFLYLVITIALMGLTKSFIGDWENGNPIHEIFFEGFFTILGIALTNLIFFWISTSRETFQGWPKLKPSLSWFGRGILIGVGMSSLMLLLTLALGGGRFVFEDEGFHAYLTYMLPLGGALLIAALSEEWLFRGYPLTKLASVAGRGWANILMALLFAVAHLSSTGSSPMSTTNIVLGSLVVGALRFTPGGIPVAWGFHFAWNYVQVLFGANLSLENIHVPGVTFSASGDALYSGGAFGPEAGIGATIATVFVLILIFNYFHRQGAKDLPLPFGRSQISEARSVQ